MKKPFLNLPAILLALLMLAGCAQQGAPASQPASSSQPPVESAPAQPVYAGQIAPGSYAIGVLSSSSMFRVVDAQLQVGGEAMSCVITMSGKGYGMLYMGTGEQALADTEEHYIPSLPDAEGAVIFEVPVAALDVDIDCAAWSIKKQTWYDRVLVFQSEQIPAHAINRGK
jgi:hypothetical protein